MRKGDIGYLVLDRTTNLYLHIEGIAGPTWVQRSDASAYAQHGEANDCAINLAKATGHVIHAVPAPEWGWEPGATRRDFGRLIRAEEAK